MKKLLSILLLLLSATVWVWADPAPSKKPFSVDGASGGKITGEVIIVDGLRTSTPQYGPGLIIQLFGEITPEHTNQTGSYDHTGGASENLFTKTAGDDFAQEDADNGNFIVLTGVNTGATAEIKEFLSTTTVAVDGFGWDVNFASQTFQIIKHPSFITGAGAKHEFSTEVNGEFEVHSYGFTGSQVVHLQNNVAGDMTDLMRLDVFNNGFDLNDAIHVEYKTGDVQPLDIVDVVHIIVDETNATNADSTTHIHTLMLEKTNVNSTIHSDAIHIGPGFTDAFSVVGTDPLDPDYGYEVSGGGVTETDRVNGVGGNDAFVNSGVDEQIFDADNDYILIGSDNTFEIISINLVTNSSRDILPICFYSKAGGDWTPFLPSDSTDGFQNSGSLTFNAPGDWTKDDESLDGSAITNAFYIAIQRTRNGAFTFPVEDIFKTFADQEGGFVIKGDGNIVATGLVSGATDAVVAGSLAGAICIDNLGNMYIDTDKICAN